MPQGVGDGEFVSSGGVGAAGCQGNGGDDRGGGGAVDTATAGGAMVIGAGVGGGVPQTVDSRR